MNKQTKYIVINKLTDAICGIFSNEVEAHNWVVNYTTEQNMGLEDNDPRYCSVFHYMLLKNVY